MKSVQILLAEDKPMERLQINRELTKALYKHLFISLPALIILASIIAWELASHYTDKTNLIIWYAVFITVVVLRGILAFWYTRTKNRSDLQSLHNRLFIINSTLIAALWGIIASVMMPTDTTGQFLLIIIMAGVTAGAVISLMPSYLASSLYASFSLIPLIFWFISQSNKPIYVDLSIAMIIYWLFLLAAGYRGYSLLANNIKLTFEKNSLLKNLSESNEKLAQSVDQLRLINSALHESEERFRQSFDYAAIGMTLISIEGQWLKANTAFCNLVGYSEKELLASDYQSITYPEDLYVDAPYYQQMLEGRLRTYQVEKRYIRKDGTVIWTLHNRVLVRDADNKPLYFISQIQDIDAQKKAEKELQYIAFHDPLTHLDNRKMLEIKFQQVQGYAQRNKHSLAVIFLDLDSFKEVNDQFGHEAGDELLKEVALRLQNSKRKTDVLSRLGGDEFVLILTEIKNEESIKSVIKSIQIEIAKDIFIKDRKVSVASSAGISFYPKDGTVLEDLLRKSDIALYKTKKIGGNGFQFYDSSM